MAICAHPNCDQHTTRSFCGRHWAHLDDDLRRRLSRTSSKDPSTRGALLAECREYFENRMLGDHEIVTCRGADCAQDIVWMQTSRGKTIPVNIDEVSGLDDVFDPKRHIAHFTTCPNADDFRRPTERREQ